MSLTEKYREFLKEILETRRRTRRGGFSLRSFAASIGVSPTTLSEVLAGKRRLSEKTLFNTYQKLKLRPQEKSLFRKIIFSKGSINKEVFEWIRAENSEPDLDVELNGSEFQPLSGWYHFVILELMRLKSYQLLSPEEIYPWIRRKLGISNEKIKESIRRMLKMNILKMKDFKPIPVKQGLRVLNSKANTALRRNNREFTLMAGKAADIQKYDECHFSGLVISADPERIGEINEVVRQFRKKIRSIINQQEDTGSLEIYRLGVHLFKVTQ